MRVTRLRALERMAQQCDNGKRDPGDSTSTGASNGDIEIDPYKMRRQTGWLTATTWMIRAPIARGLSEFCTPTLRPPGRDLASMSTTG